MKLTCDYCAKRILRSKDQFDERYELRNGIWHHRAWHRQCEPFTITVTVTQLPEGVAA